jgi:hypothetical protein
MVQRRGGCGGRGAAAGEQHSLSRRMSLLCSSLFTSFRYSSLEELGVCRRGARHMSLEKGAYVRRGICRQNVRRVSSAEKELGVFR